RDRTHRTRDRRSPAASPPPPAPRALLRRSIRTQWRRDAPPEPSAAPRPSRNDAAGWRECARFAPPPPSVSPPAGPPRSTASARLLPPHGGFPLAASAF